MGIGLSAPSVEAAGGPEITDREISGSYVIGDCGNFQLDAEYSGTMRFHRYYDDDGNLIFRRYHIRAFEDVFNSVTGFTAQSVYQTTGQRNFETGENMVTGNGWNYTIPGYGAVFFDAGRGLYVNGEDAVEVGNINYDTQEALDALCDAMDQ
jgi:hypothetical protein